MENKDAEKILKDILESTLISRDYVCVNWLGLKCV